MTLHPRLHADEYWFVAVPADTAVPPAAVAMVREAEALTLVLDAGAAQEMGLTPQMRCRMITLDLTTALEAVGLTAVFAAALAKQGIPANVVAGVFHDHLFVPPDRAEAALEVLGAIRWP